MHASTKSDYHGLLKEGSERVSKKRSSDAKVEKTKPYEEWTKEELYQEAIKAGIPGRSYMSKKNLIYSLKKY
ncbi:Rho termination factor [Flavobacterium sp. LAR06]|uniref:Rho termination factor n=1 Tax=Flavobacterium sp. LAR06 TaxID=3064897 RepID=UPI0035C0519D